MRVEERRKWGWKDNKRMRSRTASRLDEGDTDCGYDVALEPPIGSGTCFSSFDLLLLRGINRPGQWRKTCSMHDVLRCAGDRQSEVLGKIMTSSHRGL